MASAVFALALLACGPSDESHARAAVKRALKDPDSARFGSFVLVGKDRACLTVNAKNSMGGYTGDQQAYLVREGNSWSVITLSDEAQSFCVKVQGDLASQKP